MYSHIYSNCLSAEFEIWERKFDLSSCLVGIMKNNGMLLSNTTRSYRTFLTDFG